ncbi:PhzF family phenazine biosynthesis protein [Halovulum marinum]|nr:PhzF family phenazine biosynthesis protein [Halovulum marinum]
MNILRYAAFTNGPSGGNPAGVLLADALPSPEEMQRIYLNLCGGGAALEL